jgi:hypothetical protein
MSESALGSLLVGVLLLACVAGAVVLLEGYEWARRRWSS